MIVLFRVALPPGHGGTDVGAKGMDPKTGKPVYEKNFNWQLANAVKDRLAGYPIEVIIIQPSCQDPTITGKQDLYRTVAEANRLHRLQAIDMYLSLHTNAGGGTGGEIFCHRNATAKSRGYRDIVHKRTSAYLASWGYVDRGRKTSGFYELTYTLMPSVLLETLFIDTVRDVRALTNPDFMAGLASVVAAAICDCAEVEWHG